jgi:alpha-beta hydrolase superfamily lysophospholipase
MRKLLIGLAALLAIALITPVAVIALAAPKSPPAMAWAENAQRTNPDLPTPRQLQARDGTRLQYYVYPGESNQVVILIHGSVFPGPSMHELATSLRNAGVTVYVPDIRGHGGSGRTGDIDYIGQLDDDLADFVTAIGPAKDGETRTLVGFSAGGGFAVRFAGGRYGELFDRYVFLSPILPGSPAWRPGAGGWVNVSIPRIATIASLDRVGIHWFDGLAVISYAVPPEQSAFVTSSYSFRLMANFGAGSRYETYLRNIRKPATVFVGDMDEQERADQFAPLFQRLGVDIPVTIIPSMKHADMIYAPAALDAVVHAITRQQK